MTARVVPLVLVPLILLAGCSGSGEEQTQSAAPEPAVSQPASPTPDTAEGCVSATVTGTSSNAELQALAQEAYDSIDCQGKTKVAAQVKALRTDPAFTRKVDAAGLSLSGGEAMGGSTLSLVDVQGRTGCQVVGLNSPKSKMLNCGDA